MVIATPVRGVRSRCRIQPRGYDTMNPIPMDATLVSRDRLLVRTAQILIGGVLLTALCLLSTQGTIATLAYWVALPFLAAAGLAAAALAGRLWPYATAALALDVTVLSFLLVALTPISGEAAIGYTIIAMVAAAIPGAAVIMLPLRFGTIAYWGAGLVMTAIATIVLGPTLADRWYLPLGLTLFGWAAVYFAGTILVRSIPDVRSQIGEIGLAHQMERQASELEANRRQSARLLHDTVLATLTLLAHSGVGVSTEALRSQARNDAHLLRQLRLGEPLFALPGAQYAPEPVEESTLGTTLESVRERFDGLGLDVAWHGASRIALPQRVLDAFLFSISESLENVRRHAGVTVAHVTITETPAKVTAMITDAGKGFLPDEVSEQRLGIKESVIGRLAEVGGAAKVFSAPGAGTTVLLEVPR